MKLGQQPPIGTTVWLRPSTIAAPRVCYLGLSGVVVSYQQWPDVLVKIQESAEAEPREVLIYCENLALHRPRQTASGDSATGRPELRIPRPLSRRPGGMPDMKLGPGDEELPLW